MSLSTTNLHNHWTAKLGVSDTPFSWVDRVSNYELLLQEGESEPTIGVDGIEFTDGDVVTVNFGTSIPIGSSSADREMWHFLMIKAPNNQADWSYFFDSGTSLNRQSLFLMGSDLYYRSGGDAVEIWDDFPDNEKVLIEIRHFVQGSLDGTARTVQAWATIEGGETQLIFDQTVTDGSIGNLSDQNGRTFGARADGFGSQSEFTLYESAQYDGVVSQQDQEDNRDHLISEWFEPSNPSLKTLKAGANFANCPIMLCECDNEEFLNATILEVGETDASGDYTYEGEWDDTKLHFWNAVNKEYDSEWKRYKAFSGFTEENLDNTPPA